MGLNFGKLTVGFTLALGMMCPLANAQTPASADRLTDQAVEKCEDTPSLGGKRPSIPYLRGILASMSERDRQTLIEKSVLVCPDPRRIFSRDNKADTWAAYYKKKNVFVLTTHSQKPENAERVTELMSKFTHDLRNNNLFTAVDIVFYYREKVTRGDDPYAWRYHTGDQLRKKWPAFNYPPLKENRDFPKP